MANRFSIEPIDASFGATIRDIDLARLDAATFGELQEVWLEYALLVFPDQHLSNLDQVAFARRFGGLELELAPISNVKRDGSLRDDDDVMKILRGNMEWHSDSTYMPTQAKGAVFTAHVVPSVDGETGWADMRAAYDALEPALRDRISELSAYHSLYYSQSKLGHAPSEESDYIGYGFHDEDPPLRPLIKIHPETRRPALLIGRHAYGVPGMAEDESERLLRDLIDFACQRPRTYHHAWKCGDAVLWDNRCLLHRARPWPMQEARVMYHSRIAGDPTSEGASAS